MSDKIETIAVLGTIKEGDATYPMAKLLFSKEKKETVDVYFVVGCLVSLYDAFLQSIPDKSQLEFESDFKTKFIFALNERDRYMHYISNQ